MVMPEDPDIDARTWMPGSSPGMTKYLFGQTLAVMAGPGVKSGDDAATREAARRVEINIL